MLDLDLIWKMQTKFKPNRLEFIDRIMGMLGSSFDMLELLDNYMDPVY